MDYGEPKKRYDIDFDKSLTSYSKKKPSRP